MTGRWITVSLVALALAGCHKKEAAKPPAPPTTAETPAPPTAPVVASTPPPTTSEPVADTPATEPTPPAPDVTPAATPATTPSAAPTMAPRPLIRPPVHPALKVTKTPFQLAAEKNVLGAWVQSDQKTSILRFTPSGWVSLERGNSVINGKWTANSAGTISFSLPVPGGDAKLTATYANTPATGRYIVVVPNHDGPQIWPRYGQLIFNPQTP